MPYTEASRAASESHCMLANPTSPYFPKLKGRTESPYRSRLRFSPTRAAAPGLHHARVTFAQCGFVMQVPKHRNAWSPGQMATMTKTASIQRCVFGIPLVQVGHMALVINFCTMRPHGTAHCRAHNTVGTEPSSGNITEQRVDAPSMSISKQPVAQGLCAISAL